MASKKMVSFMALVAFWALGVAPCAAQSLSVGIFPDTGVLVSKARVKKDSSEPNNNSEPSLVDIRAIDVQTLHTRDGIPGMASDERMGQGIIIDPAGIIATNKHIIGNAQHIYVVLSGGKSFEANVIHNSEADLCFLKINAPFPLRAISLGDASQIQIGNPVFAIANATLNTQRKLSGQVVKLFTEVSSNDVELLEIKMVLKPGDSGGPILDEQGLLLGLIMANQKSDKTKSYAIASNKIQQEYFKFKNSTLN